jgi:hypothetical protein
MEETILSPEYQAANEAYSAAFKSYLPVRDAFRAGKITAEEFVAAAKTHDEALAAWDLAFEKERNK